MTEYGTREGRLREFRSMLAGEVRALRLSKGLSLRRLSEESGISHRAIWRIENGKSDARLSTLFVLSDALECTVADFAVNQPMVREGRELVALRLPEDISYTLTAAIENSITDWLSETLTKPDNIQSLRKSVGDAFFEGLITEKLDRESQSR